MATIEQILLFADALSATDRDEDRFMLRELTAATAFEVRTNLRGC